MGDRKVCVGLGDRRSRFFLARARTAGVLGGMFEEMNTTRGARAAKIVRETKLFTRRAQFAAEINELFHTGSGDRVAARFETAALVDG